MTKLLNMVPRRVRDYEDAYLALAVTWFIGVPAFTLTGFYLGTIIGHPWYAHPSFDYKPIDIARGAQGALIGLGVGIVFAIIISALYPRAVELDETAAAGHHDDVVID